jgi:hypothetical protein
MATTATKTTAINVNLDVGPGQAGNEKNDDDNNSRGRILRY